MGVDGNKGTTNPWNNSRRVNYNFNDSNSFSSSHKKNTI